MVTRKWATESIGQIRGEPKSAVVLGITKNKDCGSLTLPAQIDSGANEA